MMTISEFLNELATDPLLEADFYGTEASREKAMKDRLSDDDKRFLKRNPSLRELRDEIAKTEGRLAVIRVKMG